jgi:MFS family permease
MSKPGVFSGLSARAARLPIFYGWIVVFVAFVTMGLGVNARTSFSLLFPPISDEFGWDRGTIAAAFSVGFVTSMLYVPFIGMAMDRFGPGIVIPFGAVLVSGGLALATLASQPWHLYLTLGALVVGGSVFLSYIGHGSFLAHWFERRRGLAIGIAFSGVGVGSIILLPWLQGLIDGAGWRQACWAMAVLLLVVVAPLNFLFQRLRPQDMGLRPDGERALESSIPAPPQADGVIDRAWASTDWTLRRAMRTGRFWWLCMAFFSGLVAWYSIQVHQTKYLVEIGFTPDTAAYALGLVGLCGVVGQIAIGHLSDRVGREWAWSLALAGFVLCYLLLLAMKSQPTPALMYLMVAAQGLLGYGAASVFGTVPAELFQGRRYGSIFGALSVAASCGAGFGPWMTGAIFDRTGGYDLAFWLGIALCLISIACMWMAAPRKVRLVAGQVARRQRRQVSRR